MEISNYSIIKEEKNKLNYKKIIIALLSVAAIFIVLTVIIRTNVKVTNKSFENCVAGDVNGDNEINSIDALMVLGGSSGSIDLFESQIANGDVNADGQLTSADALLILCYSVNEIDKLPYTGEIREKSEKPVSKRLSVSSNSSDVTAKIVNEWVNSDGTVSQQVNITLKNKTDRDYTHVFEIKMSNEIEVTNKWDCIAETDGKSVNVSVYNIGSGDSESFGFIIKSKTKVSLDDLVIK